MSNLSRLIKNLNSVMEISVTTKNGEKPVRVEVRPSIPGQTRQEGAIPHMHVWADGSMENEVCLTLDYPAYFNHGNKPKNKLKDKQRESLNELLKRPYTGNNTKYRGLSNYVAICAFWNDTNQFKFDIPEEQPDYSGYLATESEYKEIKGIK
jgi:hypothetical protein